MWNYFVALGFETTNTIDWDMTVRYEDLKPHGTMLKAEPAFGYANRIIYEYRLMIVLVQITVVCT